MDKEEATRILAKELADRDHINLIFDMEYEQILRQNHRGMSPIWDEQGIINYLLSDSDGIYYAEYLNYQKQRAKKIGANYIFERRKSNDSSYYAGIPYAIISNDEVNIIKKELYNGDYRVEHALYQLDIFNYIEVFRDYSSNNYDKIKEYLITNGQLYISDIEVIDFLLSLPEKDHNIKINKDIITNLSQNCKKLEDEEVSKSAHYTLVKFINRSYLSKNKNFSEYFDTLNDFFRKESIRTIKNFKEKEMDEQINAELFLKGYDVPVTYMNLYKTDANSFLHYFQTSKDEQKEDIIRGIYKLKQEERNQNVETYLSNNYSELLAKVARMDIKKEK